MSLYNHTSSLTPNFDILIPPSKTLRTDMGRYPGGVDYLTDKNVIDPSIEMTTGNNTNGRIQVSISTRTLDQDYVNKYQLVWLDNKKTMDPKFLNIQSINYELINLCNPLPNSEYDKEMKAFMRTNNIAKLKGVNKIMYEKNKILERFKLFGVIANNDVDNKYDNYMIRSARGLTFTIWGSTHLLDYWSNSEDGCVSPYSTCYFIMEYIKIHRNDIYGRTLKSNSMASGIQPGNIKWQQTKDNNGKVIEEYAWAWQIIPYHNYKEEVEVKKLFSNYKDKKLLNHYWKVGHIHEYPQLTTSSILESRKRDSVSKNMAALHLNGSCIPFQFYLDISTENILF